MILFKEASAIKKHLVQLKQAGKTIGFVPTMGALHDGHISLIKLARTHCDVVVASIFVNPTQFTDASDFEKYPVTIGNDLFLLENNYCDILFLPGVAEIYPEGIALPVRYDLGEIEYILEGKYRPGHFQGVCQVVHKLLTIVNPHCLFIGQKDYQQCIVIKRLVEIINLPVKIITGATYRQKSGLALSSRNLRLNENEKKQAAAISAMLFYIKNNYTKMPVAEMEKYVAAELITHGFKKVDYVSIASADTLQPVQDTLQAGKMIALIAAYIGDVRLIDNLFLNN